MDAFEPPKYIEKLIAAINDGAKSAQAGALAFTAIGLYLLATAFATTDEDLLLEHTTTISQIGVQVPVVFSFAIAPLFFVAVHIFTLIRYDMLASNLRHFTAELSTMVPGAADKERCRQLLTNIEFVQALTAPKGSPLHSWLFGFVAWFVTSSFPVFVILIVQIGALRYQSATINWVQWFALAVDVAALFWFKRRRWTVRTGWRGKLLVVTKFAYAMAVPMVILGLDWRYVVVPEPDEVTVREGENFLDGVRFSWNMEPDQRLHITIAAAVKVTSSPLDLFLCPALHWACRFLTVDHRLLVYKVWDERAIASLQGDGVDARRLLNSIDGVFLRRRSLRFAKLDESRLYRADFIGADLRGATFRMSQLQDARLDKASLRKARFDYAQLQGADLDEADLWGATLEGANLEKASLNKGKLRNAILNESHMKSVSANGADFEHASLKSADMEDANLEGTDFRNADVERVNWQGARLDGADLRDLRLFGVDLGRAHLDGASLQNASLNGVNLQLANLHAAKLEGAEMDGAMLEGAVLDYADLRTARLDRSGLQTASLTMAVIEGASLAGAKLQGANLSEALLAGANLSSANAQGAILDGADLRGAILYGAGLQGASLKSAKLEGASLYGAHLEGANLTDARMSGADLRDTRFWQAEWSETTNLTLVDLTGANFVTPVTNSDRTQLLNQVGPYRDALERVEKALTPIEQPYPRSFHADPMTIFVDRIDFGLSEIDPSYLTTDRESYDIRLGLFLADFVAPRDPRLFNARS